MIGTVGEPCLVDKEPDFAIKNIGLFKSKSEIDGKWLYHWLRSSQAQHIIREQSRGTTQQYIPLGALRKLPVPLPDDRNEMQSVVSILSSLDDRITLLRETNSALEAIAQAIFKSWFVDFDPVKAKTEGREPEGMDAETAALFPSEFEESELGLIPKGWRVGTLQDLLVLQRGFDLPTSERVPGTFPIIAASGPSGTHNLSMAKAPGVVTGRSGVFGRVFLELYDYWPLNTTLWVKEFRGATPCYAYELLRLLDFASFNAGSAVPTLNRNHVHNLKYLIPASKCITAYEEIAIKMHQRVKANQGQSEALASLRDTLLPRLMSGQLRVPEAERVGE